MASSGSIIFLGMVGIAALQFYVVFKIHEVHRPLKLLHLLFGHISVLAALYVGIKATYPGGLGSGILSIFKYGYMWIVLFIWIYFIAFHIYNIAYGPIEYNSEQAKKGENY